MNKAKISFAVLAPLALLLLLFIVIDQMVSKSLRRVDYAGLDQLFRAGLGQIVTSPLWKPQEEKESALLWEVYLNAREVGVAAAAQAERTRLPETSAQLAATAAGHNLDPWGHPFCLSVAGEYVAVMSAGPRSDLFRRCEALHKTLGDLSSIAPGKLYEHPSGALVLLVKRE